MSGDILEAKRKLPLPALIHRLGLGEHAKKSARCPFHDDRRNSFSIWHTDAGLWFWKCHAGCGVGDEIDFLAKLKGISRSDAIKLYLEMAGCAGSTQARGSNNGSRQLFDWQQCVSALKAKDLVRLGNERWYSRAFCSQLREKHLIGLFNGFIAFPVYNNGAIVGVHFRVEDGSWRYHPQGIKITPLIIGNLSEADHVHVFESQWDAFAVCDKLRLHEEVGQAVIITRGAGNGAIVHGLIPEKAQVIAWKQNDAEKNGKCAGDEWMKDVAKHAGVLVKCAKTPVRFKDPNEWTLNGGASYDDLIEAFVQAKPTPERGAPSAADNSLNSQFLPVAQFDDYPEPVGTTAFHGPAGEIVRRIEPHTEADPAALLFQFLAAFGNVIGHDHYIVADGTHHYLNLYGVLVGQSSKGRKGTSWNHIAKLMECVDSEWKQERIAHGLSSGEGLITAVHDAIEEMKPIRGTRGRCKDEFELVIADLGEDDKRLFVIESEFANVLKVMRREGNTLSMIIRSAWDSGDLRTMVKNSPLKATRAHVSIIGHITRDELRRLLTQTESANGFANRFCWVAVKRSKCLPDGGAIQTVNFDDVIAQLQSAVDFAKDFLEIFRDPEAKKLWHQDYPDLSEGKPGMLGAITGRAEAQVMRLSAIYALLDKSRLIRPEHHRAAMALWRYCEESCRWIFGTSTGDRNADKILVALRHALNGMTKTEISVEVFNRHASSADIDEALRLLQGLGMVGYRAEGSGGAPIQRWFFTARTSEKSE